MNSKSLKQKQAACIDASWRLELAIEDLEYGKANRSQWSSTVYAYLLACAEREVREARSALHDATVELHYGN